LVCFFAPPPPPPTPSQNKSSENMVISTEGKNLKYLTVH
jgi:hypothetical protein